MKNIIEKMKDMTNKLTSHNLIKLAHTLHLSGYLVIITHIVDPSIGYGLLLSSSALHFVKLE